MSSTGSAITGAGNDFASGLAAIGEVAAGGLLILLGFLLLTGTGKSLTGAAIKIAKVIR